MKSEWKKCNLGSTMNFKNGKKRPSSTGRIPVYGGNGILDFTDQYNNEDCVVIGRVGAYCGSVFRESSKCWVSDNAICGTAREDNDIDYLYYLLKFLRLNERHIGTGQPLLTQEILNNIEILCPPLRQQKNIGKFLRTLDDKITLNNKINENLEQQAQAIYDSWFGEFNDFNNTMPSGWREGTLSDIITITSGKRPPVKQLEANMDMVIPVIGAADIMGYTNTILYNEPILVIGRVGTHGIVQRFQTPCWPSDNTLVIKSKFYEFVYQILRRIDYKSINRGSTQPLITQTDIKNISIIIPSDDKLQEFESITETLMSLWEENRKENETLSQLRDTLIPKLMSGEIDFSVN